MSVETYKNNEADLSENEHYVQAYLKQTVTDARYPRRAGKPLKAPLGE